MSAFAFRKTDGFVGLLIQSSNLSDGVSFADHEYASATVDKTHHIGADVKQVALKTYSHRPVLVTKPCRVF